MSYQFIHIEDYSVNVSKKKANQEKFNDETKGRSLRQIIAEAKREPGNCPHVDSPEAPALLYGVDLDELEAMALNYHEKTRIKDKNGKEKKLRSDANIILAGVVSLSAENIEFWDDYKKDAINFLKEKYGDKLKCVIEHRDEANPHIHFYCVQDVNERFDLIHDGKKALFENKNKIKSEQNKAYKEAMRGFQEDFFLKVSSNYGLTKDGPKRARISRAEYMKHKKEVELINLLRKKTDQEVNLLVSNAELDIKNQKKKANSEIILLKEKTIASATTEGKKEGYISAIKDFSDKNYINKIAFSRTFNSKLISNLEKNNKLLRDQNKSLMIRKDRYKQESSENLRFKKSYEEQKKISEYVNTINEFIEDDIKKPNQESLNDIRREVINEIKRIEIQQQSASEGFKAARNRCDRNREKVNDIRSRSERIKRFLFNNVRSFVRDFFSIEFFKREIEKQKNNTIEEIPIKEERKPEERKRTINSGRSLKL